MSTREAEQQRLIQAAATITWKTKDTLRCIEDALAEKFWISMFTAEQMQQHDVQRYVMLTSLPFILREEMEFTTLEEHYRIAQIMMQKLWKIEWKKEELVGGLVNQVTVPTGNLIPKYFVIGDAPGVMPQDAYDHFGRVFTRGPSSLLLRQACIHAGIHQECWFTNLSKCAMENNLPTTQEALATQLSGLALEIELLKPEYIILLGKHTQEQFRQHHMLDNSTYQPLLIDITHPSYRVRTKSTFREYGDGIRTAIDYTISTAKEHSYDSDNEQHSKSHTD